MLSVFAELAERFIGDSMRVNWSGERWVFFESYVQISVFADIGNPCDQRVSTLAHLISINSCS